MARRSTRTLHAGGGTGADGLVRRTVLPGGLRVLTEAVPGVRSATVGVWVEVGSRDETPAVAGASHFLEHLLFKGTPGRDALEIAAAFDRVGGEANAFTAKEHTCFYAHVLDRDVPMAVDVLGDMLSRSLVAAADVEAERSVVLEEISMHDDEPADAVHDAFAEALWGSSPLGLPVIGTEASITAMTRSQVHGWWRRRYTAPRMVVSAAGAVEHADVVRRVERALAPLLAVEAEPEPLRPEAGRRTRGSGLAVWDRPTEQANLVLGMAGLPRRDPRRFALGVLSNALGGGMSSRLFQEVREKRGLVYSVYSFTNGYADAGLFGVYAGCQPRRLRQVLDVCRDQLADVAASGLTAEEVERGKGQLRGGLVLGLEETSTRMSRLGKGELSYGEVLSTDEVLARIDAVTVEQVHAVAAQVLTQPLVVAGVGRFRDDAVLRDVAGTVAA